MAAKWKHDCAVCKTLGQYGNYDLYFCCDGVQTLVARYGNEGGDYESGLHGESPQLHEARVRAIRLGYLVPVPDKKVPDDQFFVAILKKWAAAYGDSRYEPARWVVDAARDTYDQGRNSK